MNEWIDLSVSELTANPTKTEIMETIPDSPGIYVWRRTIPPFPTGPVADIEAFVNDLCERESASIGPNWIAPSIRFEGIKIGTGPINEQKKPVLKRVLATPKGRRMLEKHIGSMERFSLPQYVGSAGGLATRVYQHLHDQTDFSIYVRDQLQVNWDHFKVSCMVIGKEYGTATKEYLELLELVAQRLFAPTGVQRAG